MISSNDCRDDMEPDLTKERILQSLEQSGYFPHQGQIQVSVTPDRTVHLRGVVDSYFLKQRAICSALQTMESNIINDCIQVR